MGEVQGNRFAVPQSRRHMRKEGLGACHEDRAAQFTHVAGRAVGQKRQQNERAHHDRVPDPGRLLPEEGLDKRKPFLQRPHVEAGQVNHHGEAADERVEQRGARILGRGPDEHNRGLAQLRVPQRAVDPPVHEQEQHLLAVGGQAMDLIQEQHAAVGLCDETGRVPFRAREGALHVAEQLGLQQLRVCRIVSAVENAKRRPLGEAPHGDGILVHRFRQPALAGPGGTGNERGQAARGIKHRRLGLFHRGAEASAIPDELLERVIFQGRYGAVERATVRGDKPDGPALYLQGESFLHQLVEIGARVVSPEANHLRHFRCRHAAGAARRCKPSESLQDPILAHAWPPPSESFRNPSYRSMSRRRHRRVMSVLVRHAG